MEALLQNCGFPDICSGSTLMSHLILFSAFGGFHCDHSDVIPVEQLHLLEEIFWSSQWRLQNTQSHILILFFSLYFVVCILLCLFMTQSQWINVFFYCLSFLISSLSGKNLLETTTAYSLLRTENKHKYCDTKTLKIWFVSIKRKDKENVRNT